MKKYLFSLLLVATTLSRVFAQTPNTPLYDPFNARLRPKYNDSLPEFVKLTLKSDVNMFEVAKAFEAYEKAHKGEDEKEVENPFDVYYHRWQRAYAPFVQEDGSIQLPAYTAFQEKLKAENTAYNAAALSTAAKQENLVANWTCVGPKETFWLKDDNPTQSACPWQVNIYAFDVSKSNNNVLYAATETGAVFKTSDKGLNWTVCANGFNFGGSGEAIAIHPTNPSIVFLGVGSNIYKTTDGGDTWVSVYNSTPLYPNAIVISPTDPNLVLVAAYGGLLRSTNGGSTWTQIYSEPCDDVEINPLSTTHVFILKYNGINLEFLKSTNSGVSFTTVNTGITNAISGRLAVTAADGNRIYALLTTDTQSKLIKSINEGAAWSTTTVTFCTGGISDAYGGQGYYDLAIAASPSDANKIIFGMCSTHKSTDGGATSSFVGGYCGLVAVHPDLQEVRCIGSDVWVATDGGLTLSTDFLTSNYEARNNGIFAADFWGFGQGWNEDIMVGGRYHNGNTAMADFYPSGKALRMGGGEAGTGYVLPGQTRAVAFSDLGSGWTLPASFNGNSEGRFLFTKYPNEDNYGYNSSPLTTDPRYSKHIYLGEGTTFWKTTDGGATFNALHDFGSSVRRYEISRSNPNVLYLTTDDDFYKSTDGGVNWVARNIPSGHTAQNMRINLSATDENLLWASFENAGITLSGKVYKSTNGGSTWTDMTTPTLNTYNIKWVQMANNTEGGVYIAAVNNQGRVFYIDNTKSDWENFSTNLPASMDIIRIVPFYRDAKLRVAGNRGVWETPLYNENFAPIAQPMTDKKTSRCVRDTFYFDDYSIVKHAGTTWAWSFSPTPQYVSNANSRNPKVVFGSMGNYNVTLTVTNPNGTSTKTETNMVSFPTDECSPETVAGKAMSLTTTSDYFLTPSLNLGTTTNTVTLMAWIKPNGPQSDFAGIITSSSSNVGINLTSSNDLRLNWNDVEWWWSSGLTVPSNTWSHIALVVTGTNMTFYLNGKAVVHTSTQAALNLSNINWYIGCDRGRTDRVFKGMIDEVAFYNRALTQTEVREQMHLTKLSSDVSMKGYFQFNETSGDVFNRVGMGSAAFVGSAGRAISSAPVASGTSETQTVTSSGIKTFTTAGITLTFPSSGTLPNGSLCITRLNGAPDQLPNNYPSGAKNWLINNYGTNATFAALTNMTLTGYGSITPTEAANPSNFRLYKREMGQLGNTWGSAVGSGNSALAGANGIVSFNAPITSFSQFIIMQEPSVLPLTLTDFTLQKVEKKHAQLHWTTLEEKNMAYFDIERSYDGSHFEKIGTVKSVGQTIEKQTYSFLDNTPLSNFVYYRLRMVDADEKAEFSKIQSLDFDKTVDILIYPNPVGKGKILVVKTNLDESFEFRLSNMSGKTVLTKNVSTPEMQLDTEGLDKGLYLFELKSKSHWRFGKIVVE